MSLASNLTTAFTRIGTEFKSYRAFLTGSGTGAFTGLTTTAQNVTAAINEINAKPGGGGTLDSLSDVVITTPAAGHIVRHNGTNFVNDLGITHFQPRDTDLDAIAALATTAYGRAFLQLADQAALMALVPANSETVAGKTRLATQAEVDAGTENTAAVTALKLQTRLAAYAQPKDADLEAIALLTTTAYGRAFLTLANQAGLTALLPISTDVTLAGNSDTLLPSQKAVKTYADSLINANDAMVYKGVIDCSANPSYPAASAGWTYRVSVAGKIGGAAGPNVEAGDTITCLSDNTATGTHATVGTSWNIIQANIDGAVTGPAASTNGDFAMFSGVGGKVIADTGLSFDTDATLAAGSNSRIPSQLAVKTYAYSKTEIGNPETDFSAQFVAALA